VQKKSLCLNSFLLSSIILVFIIGLATPNAFAAPGGYVHKTTFDKGCSSGIGVGVAFDGTHLWYSCYSSPTDLYRADALTGVVDKSYSIVGGLGALAYDSANNVIYAGPGSGSNNPCTVLKITLDGSKEVTGSSVKFTNSNVCTSLDDGLAYDGTDDTFYFSNDSSQTIFHISATGVDLDSFTWNGSGCGNSGLAIGGNQLFEGSNGCNHVWVVNKVSKAAIFNFPTNVVPGDSGFRDEDLECDTTTFSSTGKQVMWSMEAYEPRRAAAFEIQPNTCGQGGLPPTSGVVGGEILPIDSTALLIAGAQANSYSILAALSFVGAIAFGSIYLVSKRKI